MLALDLPGFGGTEASDAVWDLDDYARFVTAVLDKLHLSQPYAVVGHSNGGALTIRAVSMGLLQPQKIVLLAAAGVRTNSRIKRFFLKVIAKTGNIATMWMPERYRRVCAKASTGLPARICWSHPILKIHSKRPCARTCKATP